MYRTLNVCNMFRIMNITPERLCAVQKNKAECQLFPLPSLYHRRPSGVKGVGPNIKDELDIILILTYRYRYY